MLKFETKLNNLKALYREKKSKEIKKNIHKYIPKKVNNLSAEIEKLRNEQDKIMERMNKIERELRKELEKIPYISWISYSGEFSIEDYNIPLPVEMEKMIDKAKAYSLIGKQKEANKVMEEIVKKFKLID